MAFIPQVDTQIPLSVANPLDLQAKGFALGQAQLEAQRETSQYNQQQDSQRALKDIFARADTSTAEGQADVIRQVGRVDPKAAIGLQTQFQEQAKARADIGEKNALAQEHKANTDEMYHDDFFSAAKEMQPYYADAMTEYGDRVKGGELPEKVSREVGSKLKRKLTDVLGKYSTDNPYLNQVRGKMDTYDNLTATDLQQKKEGVDRTVQAWSQIQQQKKTPVGYTQNPQKPGELMPIPGGPADTKQVSAVSEAKRETPDQAAAIARAREKAKSEAQGGGGLSEETKQFMAKQYLAGDKSVLQNIGRGNQGAKDIVAIRNAIQEEAKKKGLSPEETASKIAEFEGLKSGERALGTRTANVEMAVSEAQNSAKIALAASEKFPRTEWMPVNKALAALESGGGSVEARRFGAAVNTFINTYARAISPTGTPTVSDKDHAREILSTADSPEQFKGVMDILQQEMAAARKAPGQVRQEFREGATGKKEAPAAAIEHLKGHPELKDAFKAKYGYLPDGV
jgi:hypothetical protein